MQRELIAIPLAQLTISEPSKRHQDREKISRLAWNLKSTGQLNPLIVRRLPGGERYEIIAGGMRSFALRAAGRTHADCVVMEQGKSEAELLKVVISENLQRFDPDVMEFSRQVCRFMAASDLNGTDTARELGISVTEVSRCRERVYDWCEELQRLAEAEQIAPSTAHAVHRIEIPEKREEAMRLAAEGKLTRDAAFLQARECRAGRPPAGRSSKQRIQLTLPHGAVALTLKTFSEETVVDLFAEALKRSRKALASGCRGDVFLNALRKVPAKQRLTSATPVQVAAIDDGNVSSDSRSPIVHDNI